MSRQPSVTSCTDVDLTGGVAIIVGAEHDGLSGEWLQRADQSARLPMLGHLNSLNVYAVAAIVIHEALRQRQTDGRREEPDGSAGRT
ncbi:MAG: TrmH family RNA methyltransferase [Nocardioidaceae bacterium]